MGVRLYQTPRGGLTVTDRSILGLLPPHVRKKKKTVWESGTPNLDLHFIMIAGVIAKTRLGILPLASSMEMSCRPTFAQVGAFHSGQFASAPMMEPDQIDRSLVVQYEISGVGVFS